MYLDPPSWDRGTSASDYILKALNTIITAINTANNIILIQGKCILVVESALYGMFCVCNLSVIGRTNKNKLLFLNSQHTWMLQYDSADYLTLLIPSRRSRLLSKNSGQRNHMALEVIRNSQRIIPLPSASHKKFWPES